MRLTLSILTLTIQFDIIFKYIAYFFYVDLKTLTTGFL